MLRLLLASIFLIFPYPGTASTQAETQAVTVTANAKLSATELADLQKRADAGDASAQFKLGKAYETGDGVPQRPDQTVIWYRKSAEQGNAKAQNSLGVLYWMGEGVEKDKVQAVGWYRRAARQGDGNAMFNLGAAYYNGEGVGVNDTLAYAWFLLSSETGSVSGKDAAERSQKEHSSSAFNEACFAIGQIYEKGEDLPQNFELAAAWYRKAAEKGHTEAQVSLAILAMKAKDYAQTRHWCEMASKIGYAGGYSCLGYLYQHGLGVEQDSKEAFSCYLRAARGNNPGAMRAVAQMYENGEGIKMDRSEAFLWFFILGRKRSKDALLDAQRVRSTMTEKEWKDAQKKLQKQAFDLKEVDEMIRNAASQNTQ